MAKSTIPAFQDIPEIQLTPPEEHPLFVYEGFQPGKTVKFPRGHVLREGFCAFPIDTALDLDCEVPMRDGVCIYTNVYRPDGPMAPKQPALIAWSPYGKSSGGVQPQNYDTLGPYRIGIPYHHLSGYETFEGPNPADWVRRGYCVVDPDARGAGHSGGKIVCWGQQEAQDIYDLVEWCIGQAWCDGTVVMFGNSWLAMAQLNHAVRCPHPALRAIAPWEAATDPYKDMISRGGIIMRDSFARMIMGGLAGYGKAEDIFSAPDVRPLYDDYWQSKHVDVSRLRIPAYLTASYSSRFHSRASFESFSKAPNATTWLRVHATQEWQDLYQQRNMDELQKFFDHYAKGEQNDWQNTPHLRLSLLAMVGSVQRTIEERIEDAHTFPLPWTQDRKFFLDGHDSSLGSSPPSASHSIGYDAHSKASSGQISFSTKFDCYTELSGLPWARLYVSCKEHTDMDMHIIVRKVGIDGRLLSHNNYPVPVSVKNLVNSNVAKFEGATGALRASHTVSQKPKAHPNEYPEHTHRIRKSIEPGTIVSVEIPIWPIGMVFGEGEGVQVTIAGHDLKLPEIPSEDDEKILDENKGVHRIHTGGEYQSFIMLPFIAG